ncbi:hypothetical protein RA265_29815, partial [Pseudomonas syringae pv. tagetis]|uniref:hypothetical protein n=1 Tax=Pseudomonas syringae group genomosp. 7 TaxID=251699 RepID=UPI00376F8D1B
DVAKVLAQPPDQLNALADAFSRSTEALPSPERLREYGCDADMPILKRVLALTSELSGFPRHLSHNPGGFVISEHPLDT